VTSHDDYAHRILTELESGAQISQRSLARRLGIALGLTNLLLRRFVRKGWIRMTEIQPHRVSYLLTPQGVAEKARLSTAAFQNSVQFYVHARERIRSGFDVLTREWPLVAGRDNSGKPIVFIGTDEVAEIAYVCLQETDLRLVGVVDFQGRQRFFGVPVYPAIPPGDELRACLESERPILIAFNDGALVRTFLREAGVPPERVYRI
jgi:DNA-binding MarR family transcriptional regulator